MSKCVFHGRVTVPFPGIEVFYIVAMRMLDLITTNGPGVYSGEGAPYIYLALEGNRPVKRVYYAGDEVTPPSVVPFSLAGEGAMPWDQDKVALAQEIIRRGGLTVHEFAAFLNAPGQPCGPANAVVNFDSSVTWDMWVDEEADIGETIVPIFMSAFAAATIAAAAAATATATVTATAPAGVEVAVDWNAVASGWEGLAADSAIQNVALAEVTGQVAPGTLAEMVGEQAASSALEAANAIAHAPAVNLPQTPPSPPTQTTSPPSKLPLNANTIRQAGQLLQYGTQLYRMVAGSDETGPILTPQRAGYVDPQGNLIYSGAGSNMGGALLALLGLAFAGAIVLRS